MLVEEVKLGRGRPSGAGEENKERSKGWSLFMALGVVMICHLSIPNWIRGSKRLD